VLAYHRSMASDDDDTSGAALGAGLVLGLLGGVLLGAALASQSSPQAQFEQRLRQRLKERGFGLASARLGHGSTGPIWIVTVRFPDASLITVQATVGNDQPFDPTLADDIGDRVANALRVSAA
jgi:hypothetical protein